MVGSNQAARQPVPPSPRGEGFATRWRRRALTIPLYIALGGATLLLLPVLIMVAAVADITRGRRFGLVRCVLALALYITCEALGLLASLVVWLASGVWAGASRERFIGWNHALQNLWARALLHGAMRIFGMRLHITTDEDIGDAPLFVFIRHASTVDTLLPAVILERPYGFRLRYVMKRELLWDPCLDVVGQRTRHLFVRRGSGDGAAEIEAVRRLAEDLGPKEGVLLYPEGTRATPAKRKRALEHIEASGDARRLDRVRALHHTLPPRLGGAMALLEARPEVAVLFVAHVGFDGVESLRDLWRGALVGREIRVMMRKVNAAEIPRGFEARATWLDEEWAKVDRWIGEQESTELTHENPRHWRDRLRRSATREASS